jgi:hypothetical protein
MKYVLKLESAGLLILFTCAYFHFFPGAWGFYLALFFVPDVSFAMFLVSKKAGAIAYNIFTPPGVTGGITYHRLFNKRRYPDQGCIHIPGAFYF